MELFLRKNICSKFNPFRVVNQVIHLTVGFTYGYYYSILKDCTLKSFLI